MSDKMAQQVVHKFNDLSSIPRNHLKMGGENECHKVVLWLPQAHHGACPLPTTHMLPTHVHTRMHTYREQMQPVKLPFH